MTSPAPGVPPETATPGGDLVADLCDYARRELTRSGEEFADAIAAGDDERADKAIGEAVELSEALKRQEVAPP